jgi:hypothetical protein
VTSQATGGSAADPAVDSTVRLLHRRHSWARLAATSLIAFALAGGAYSNAVSEGTPPPAWFLDVVVVLGALTVAGIIASVADSVLLRRRPPEVRAQAAPIAARHPHRPHALRYPVRHRLIWTLRWVGMLLLLTVAVVSVPAVVDGTAYLAGIGKSVTFDPLSYSTHCYQGNCQTSTVGILETGGAGVSASWQDVVPLGKPFKVREPVWRWGLGLALINDDATAVLAVGISLLIEAFGVLVLVALVRLARHSTRFHTVRTGQAPMPSRLR